MAITPQPGWAVDSTGNGVYQIGTPDPTLQSAPAPAATPPASTAAPSANATGRYPTGDTAPDTSAPGYTPAVSPETSAEDTYMQETAPEDPATIESRIQSEYAPEIASIQQYYNSLIAQQNTTAEGESGQVRAEEAQSGELGQDIGEEQSSSESSLEEQQMATITGEEASAVGGVEGTEATGEESEITGEKATQQTAQAGYVSYLSQQAQQAQSQIATVAGQYDLSTLPQDEYDSLYEASGFATPDQFNSYYSAVRQSSLTGGKTLGDSTSGVYQQQADGSWKVIIPGSAGTIGDPSTGVWQKDPTTGAWTNVIPATVKSATIGSQGSFVYNPTTGAIQTVAPQGSKFMSSNGVIYSINETTGAATPIAGDPTNGQGWDSNSSASGLQKSAILSYFNSLGLSTTDYNNAVTQAQNNPNFYYTALGNATQSGYYTNTSLGVGTGPAPAATTGTDTTDTTDTSSDTQSQIDELTNEVDDLENNQPGQ
jgi:hypothetical protein